MKKHLEIKTYEYQNVKVVVKIDYDNRTISLLENPQGNGFKSYIFAKRSLEYMDSWRKALEAIRYTIDEAEKELLEFINDQKA